MESLLNITSTVDKKEVKCDFPFCGRKYSTISNMRRHSREKHGMSKYVPPIVCSNLEKLRVEQEKCAYLEQEVERYRLQLTQLQQQQFAQIYQNNQQVVYDPAFY